MAGRHLANEGAAPAAERRYPFSGSRCCIRISADCPRVSGRILQAVGKLVDAGKLRPLIDSARFTLETAPDAHRRLESGQARGKVVFDIG